MFRIGSIIIMSRQDEVKEAPLLQQYQYRYIKASMTSSAESQQPPLLQMQLPRHL